MKKFYAIGILSVLNFNCSQTQQSTPRQSQDGGIKKQQHSWIERDESKGQEAADSSQGSGQIATISSTTVTADKKEKLLDEVKSDDLAQGTQQSEVQDAQEINAAEAGFALLAVKNKKPKPGTPPAPAPDKAEELQALIEACTKALDLDGYPNFAIYNFEAKSFNKVVLNVPSSEPYAIVRINADKRVNKVDVKLTNPQGKYCFELSAGNAINKVKLTSACTAEVKILSVTAKRWNKVDLNLCI